MMKGLLILVLTISSTFAANDAFKEPSLMPSDYVTQGKCIELQKKYSSKYDQKVLNHIFSIHDNSLPSVDEIFHRLNEIEGRDTLPYLKAEVLAHARCSRNIDDIIYSLLNRAVEYEVAQQRDFGESIQLPEYPMTLEAYLNQKIKIQYLNIYDHSKDTNIAFPIKKFPVTQNNKKITVRERLYTLYNEKQMEKMAMAMSFVIDTMNADRVITTISFNKDAKRDNYVIDHNAGDIYRLAVKIFKQKQAELRQERFFAGKPVSNIDILAAAHEWGVLTDKEISILTSDEAFFVKEVSFLTKLRKYFTGLGLSVAQINPTTAPYALIGVILYNSYQEMNKGQDRVELENMLF